MISKSNNKLKVKDFQANYFFEYFKLSKVIKLKLIYFSYNEVQ
jgi:hypothetical protein